MRFVVRWGGGVGAMCEFISQTFTGEKEIQAVLEAYPEIIGLIADAVEELLIEGRIDDPVDDRPMFQLARK